MRKLARAFLTRIRRLVNKPDLTFSDQALSEITNRSWPGNIRQLENMVERAVNIASHDKIQVEDLGLGDAEEQPFLPEKETLLKNMEKQMIQRLMEKHKGNVSKVARLLGISRPTLYRKLDLHGLREKTG